MKPKLNDKNVVLDERYTPPYAVTPLIDFLRLESNKISVIWESASGRGDLAVSLKSMIPKSIKVIETTLNCNDQSGDFFDNNNIPNNYNKNEIGIITNPPYSIKYEWISRCFDLSNNFALLLPVESLASSKLRTLFKKHGGISVLFMDSRIDFIKDNQKIHESSAQFPSAWFIFGFGVEMNKMFDAVSIKNEKSEFKKSCRMINI